MKFIDDTIHQCEKVAEGAKSFTDDHLRQAALAMLDATFPKAVRSSYRAQKTLKLSAAEQPKELITQDFKAIKAHINQGLKGKVARTSNKTLDTIIGDDDYTNGIDHIK